MRGTLVATVVVILLMSETTSAFNKTNKVLGALTILEKTARDTIGCPTSLTQSTKLETLVGTTKDLYNELSELNVRCGTVKLLSKTVLLIPGVNIILAPILAPFAATLKWLTLSLKVVLTAVEPVVNTLKRMEVPLQTTKTNSGITKNVLLTVTSAAVKDKTYLTQLATEISKVDCMMRPIFLQTIEAASIDMEAAPEILNMELQMSNGVCKEIQNYVVSTDAKINADVLRGFTIAKDGVALVNKAIDPIQKYLDIIDEQLDRKLCIPEVNEILEKLGLDKIIEDVVKTGKDVIDEVVEKGKEIIDDITNFFSKWGRRRRRAAQLIRNKREICFTIRQIMGGTLAIDAGFLKATKFIVEEIFKVLPNVPGFQKNLEDLAASLLPFKTDFDLATKSAQLIPPAIVVKTFVVQNYTALFINRPDPAMITLSTPTTCPGGVPLAA